MANEVNRKIAPRKKKSKRKTLNKSFIIIFSLILVVSVILILCCTVFFNVDRISINGSSLYTKEEIITASKLNSDDNLLLISEDSIEETIRKQLPYVDNVKLKRVFPDGVILTITDAKDYSYFKNDNNYFIVSKNGYVLKKQSEKPKDIFEIITTGISGNTGEKIVYKSSDEEKLVNRIKDLLIKEDIKIDSINVKNAIQITVNVEGKFTVILGKNEYINEKIAHLATMIENIGDRKGTINLKNWTPQKKQSSFVKDKS